MTLLQLYHSLPYPLRVLAVSAKGYQLRNQRYGPETDRLVKEALERELWSAEEWKAWREERLAYILKRAAAQVPYYRAYWADRRRHGDKTSYEKLENWPILKKEEFRKGPEAFVAEDRSIKKMHCEPTSGSTGTPIKSWWSAKTTRSWYALTEARIKFWNKIGRDERWAILGGKLVTPFRQRKPPFWVWNQGLSQLYLSSYHLKPDFIPYYLDAIKRHKILYIFAYPSSVYSLAMYAGKEAFDYPVKAVITNAEPLYEYQRSLISRVFQCPVRDTYGMAELAAAGSECENGHMHMWPEAGIIEVMEDEKDEPVPPGHAGRFICTGLLNEDMPLIRYEVGDRGNMPYPETKCGRKRNLPIIERIEGRNDDVVITSDGRRVGRLDHLFKADIPIKEAQLVQDRPDHLKVRFVPAAGFSEEDKKVLLGRMRQYVGEMDIVFEAVEDMPRSPNGKFRFVISSIGNE